MILMLSLNLFVFQRRSFSFILETLKHLLAMGNKYKQFQSIVKSTRLGIYCFQDTNSKSCDILRYPFLHYFLSGTQSDSHAGGGFAIPSPRLSIVYDLYPWDFRLAVLILNTRPYKLALFSVFAPSQFSNPAKDQLRKEQFWHQPHHLFPTTLPTTFQL